MIELKIKTCVFCREHEEDGAGCIYPYFGLAPHVHTPQLLGTELLNQPYPENFSPDSDGMGVYTHCLYCGADGSEMDLSEEVVRSLKEVS